MKFRLKAILAILWIPLVCGIAAAMRGAPVNVQDFEEGSALPSAWVVNIPNENASVEFSSDNPHDGKRCLKLRYHFVSTGNFQYLGVENKVTIPAPIHRLGF